MERKIDKYKDAMLCDKMEIIKDMANNVYSFYFSYNIEHNIDIKDNSNLLVKYEKESYDIGHRQLYYCETHEDFRKLEDRLTELSCYLGKFIAEDMKKNK